MENKEKTNDLCHVCGNTGAKVHYKGMLCGRCRVFYIRCVKERKPLSCINGMNCQLTSEKRANCAFCRFQKCCELNMDKGKVGQVKKYRTKVFAIQQGFVRYFMKSNHPTLLQKSPAIVPGDIETIIICHKQSLNEFGPSPSSFQGNLDIPIDVMLQNPELVSSRNSACFDRVSFDPNIRYDLQRQYCRWAITLADFYRSTHYFFELDMKDQIKLAQHNCTTFHFLTLLDNQLKHHNSRDMWENFSQRFRISPEGNALFMKAFKSFFGMSRVIEPLHEEMKIDEYELTVLKVLGMFSAPTNFSEPGIKKVHFVKETYTLKLLEHIDNVYPEMSRTDQLMRLKKLIEIVRLVSDASLMMSHVITEATIHNIGDMKGRLSYDFHVKNFS